MRSSLFHSAFVIAFVAIAACGGKTLPGETGSDPDSGIVTKDGGVQTDGTCTTPAPDCGVDECGFQIEQSCSEGLWSCIPQNDECAISPPPPDPIDGSIGIDATVSTDGGVVNPPDASVSPPPSGIPCGDQIACPANMFCQEQSDFTLQCALFPAACVDDQTCTCVLDNGTSACPQDFGWSCGQNSAGDVEWTCTAP